MDFAIKLTVSTWRARAWLRFVALLAPLLGSERATRWGTAGVYRLARYRINGGPWQRMERR